MSDTLLQLGPWQFYSPKLNEDTPAPQTLQRESNFNVPAQNRLSRDQAHQFTGPGEETYSIEGVLYPHFFGGISTLEGIRALGREGKPHQLMRFYKPPNGVLVGEPIGNFLVRRIKGGSTKISKDGYSHRIEFSIELIWYGDDNHADTTPGASTGGLFT